MKQTLSTATFEFTLDGFPANGEIRLPKPPLRMVDAIYYFDPAGQQQIVPSNSYTVDITAKPGRIHLKPGREWPETDGSAASVRIAFTAGHENAAAVPAVLRQAIKFLVAHWYEHREAATDRRIDNVPMTVQSILDRHSYPEAA